MKDSIEIVTVYRGRDSATYSLKEYMKHGDKTKPLWVRQYPSDRTPFIKIKLGDADGFMTHHTVTKRDFESNQGQWDKDALKKLLTEGDK